MAGDMVKVDRGDGHLFKMTRKAADRFLSRNSRAHLVGASPAPAARAATPAAADSALGTMTREELNAYAATLGVQDAEGARTKADVIALIEEALRQAQDSAQKPQAEDDEVEAGDEDSEQAEDDEVE